MTAPLPPHLTLAADPVLPAWLVLPVTALVMIVIAWHTLALQHPDVPASRRRIRSANGVVMLIAVAAIAHAAGLADPDHERRFVLAWLLVVCLLGIVIMLALMDMANNIRLSTRERRALREQARQALLEDLRARRESAS